MSDSDGAGRGGGQRGRPRARGDDPVVAGLRQLWRGLEAEPVPDDFLALIERIESAPGEDAPGRKGGQA